MKKRIFVTIMGILLFLSLNSSLTTLAAESDSSDVYIETPANYIEYLENYSAEDAAESGVGFEFARTAVSESEESLEKFNNLSPEEQNLFLEYLTDPSKYVELDENPSDLPMFSLMATARTISHEATLGILGIPITKYRVTGVYEYTSTRATKALSTTGIVVHNFNPLVQTSNTSKSGYITSGVYVGTATFRYAMGPFKGLSAQLGTYTLEVVGGPKGKLYGTNW